MSTLSDFDIEKEIGINIYIYPFFKKNLRGASYNLTASKLAWDLDKKETIYDPQRKQLIIPKHSTVLIETNESIWVSKKISGTYHSKVGLVSKGLSHIGTTLDPEYIGPSLITVHNHSGHEITLAPEDDTFVTLVFHYLRNKASSKSGNNPGRPDVLNGFKLSEQENKWLDEDFRKIPEKLKEEMKCSQDFKEILKKREALKARLSSGVKYLIPIAVKKIF